MEEEEQLLYPAVEMAWCREQLVLISMTRSVSEMSVFMGLLFWNCKARLVIRPNVFVLGAPVNDEGGETKKWSVPHSPHVA